MYAPRASSTRPLRGTRLDRVFGIRAKGRGDAFPRLKLNLRRTGGRCPARVRKTYPAIEETPYVTYSGKRGNRVTFSDAAAPCSKAAFPFTPCSDFVATAASARLRFFGSRSKLARQSRSGRRQTGAESNLGNAPPARRFKRIRESLCETAAASDRVRSAICLVASERLASERALSR